MVRGFNMVTGFGGGGALVSFLAPYLCPSCAQRTDKLVDMRERDALARLAMHAPCAHFQASADFDEVVDVYCAYAASQGVPSLSPGLERALGSVARVA